MADSGVNYTYRTLKVEALEALINVRLAQTKQISDVGQSSGRGASNVSLPSAEFIAKDLGDLSAALAWRKLYPNASGMEGFVTVTENFGGHYAAN